MESKGKSGSKASVKAEKKEMVTPLKPDPTPAEPAEAPKPVDDGTGNQEANGAAGGACEMLESLKPFLIGGAIVALGAIVVGVVLLAKKK